MYNNKILKSIKSVNDVFFLFLKSIKSDHIVIDVYVSMYVLTKKAFKNFPFIIMLLTCVHRIFICIKLLHILSTFIKKFLHLKKIILHYGLKYFTTHCILKFKLTEYNIPGHHHVHLDLSVFIATTSFHLYLFYSFGKAYLYNMILCIFVTVRIYIEHSGILFFSAHG